MVAAVAVVIQLRGQAAEAVAVLVTTQGLAELEQVDKATQAAVVVVVRKVLVVVEERVILERQIPQPRVAQVATELR